MARYIDDYFTPFTVALLLGAIAVVLLYALAVSAVIVAAVVVVSHVYKRRGRVKTLAVDLLRKSVLVYAGFLAALSLFGTYIVTVGTAVDLALGLEPNYGELRDLRVFAPVGLLGLAVFLRYGRRLWGPSIYETTGIDRDSLIGIALEEIVRKGLSFSLLSIVALFGVAALATGATASHALVVGRAVSIDTGSFILTGGVVSLGIGLLHRTFWRPLWGRPIGDALAALKSARSERYYW